MAKRGGSHHKRGSSHKRGGTHHRRGGSHKMRGGSNYSSAASYGSYVNGGTNAQFDRVFAQNGNPSNIIFGVQGQNAQLASMPTPQNLQLIQSGGKRGKKGGLLGIGPVLQQAAVPFTLVALNDRYSRSKGKKGGSLGLLPLLEKGAVPFTILGMQNYYGKTRKNR
jgi:hypothetical protein